MASLTCLTIDQNALLLHVEIHYPTGGLDWFLYRIASESQDQPKRLTSVSVTLVKGYHEAVQIQGKETSVYGREKTVPHFGNSPKDSMLTNRNSGRFLEALAFSAICIGVQKRKWTLPPKRRKKCLLGIMKSLYGNFRFSVIQDKTLEMLAVLSPCPHWLSRLALALGRVSSLLFLCFLLPHFFS